VVLKEKLPQGILKRDCPIDSNGQLDENVPVSMERTSLWIKKVE
jgi:hypothetical protein